MNLLNCLRALSVVMLFGSAVVTQAATGADSKFEKQFGDTFFSGYWQLHPDDAISNGYYRTAGLMIPPTAASRVRTLHYLDVTLAQLLRVDPGQLSANNRTDWALLKTQLESERWAVKELRSWSWNPASYNVSESIATLLNTDYAPLEQRLRTVSQRLAAVPAYYAAAKASVDHPTREHTQLAIQQNGGALDLLGSELDQRLANSKLGPRERAEFQQRLVTARAAVADYIAWLKLLDDRQAKDGGARDFRLGAALYEKKFSYDIQSGGSAEQLYQRALAEKESLHARMAMIADQLWPKVFPDTPAPPDRLVKIGQVIAKLSEQHAKREEFFDVVRQQIPSLEAWVSEHQLVELDPSRPLQVRLTPVYQRGVSIASINAPGPYDPTAKTYYNVSPLDGYTPEQAESFLREYNNWILQILNIHEAVPGHYLQLIHANKSPSRIKAVFGNGAMVEGWAVYAERMMLESGYGNNAPEMWLMYSKWNLRSVCNTILDFRVHVLGLGEADALKLLTTEAFQSETEARGKWRRVQLSQVQLTSYFAGYSAIYDYRERLKAELGERFDLKRFHEKFLSYGSAPVAVIESLIRPAEVATP